jgi:hypothetical protein
MPTLDDMGSQAVRIETETLQRLRTRSAQSGEPIARLAQRYIDEGMRLERHPGIFFRTGPAGRRAVLVGGPDVWEVIVAVIGAEERGEALIQATAERVGIPPERVRVAIGYYAAYPEEIDQRIEANEQAAIEHERELANRRRILE